MAKIDRYFDQLLAQKGSDLHLSAAYPPMIRARGELVPLNDTLLDQGASPLAGGTPSSLLTNSEVEGLLLEICTPEQRAHITGELDLDFAYAFGEKARFRANYFHKTTGMAAVFRIIPTKILSLKDLDLGQPIRELAERRSGLVLVTGPTGSGKSTTLAAMVDHINQHRACHILTIEDPVEFVHVSKKAQITHREVGRDAPSFQAAIRSAGREDPNVILVGELRNNETMKLALQLASFGILVYATVHTNSAPATIDRVINAFPADEQPQVRGMLAESLVGIVAQQLLRTADGKGRVAAHEILLGTSGVSAMIREGKTFQIRSLMQAGQAIGMQTMDMALERLVGKNVITPEAALEKALDKESFAKLMAKHKPELAASLGATNL